ncbi:hypothetical protein Droror1_Dr00019757 [Drosera rotundifolia]
MPPNDAVTTLLSSSLSFSSTFSFTRRLFLFLRLPCSRPHHHHSLSDSDDEIDSRDTTAVVDRTNAELNRTGSGKLSDLLQSESKLLSNSGGGDSRREENPVPLVVAGEDGGEVRRRMERHEEMKRAATMLLTEGSEERGKGAVLVRRLAKDDAEARVALAMLGLIPTLVRMIDEEGVGDGVRVEAVYGLLNLGIGNDINKAAIVQAGAVHRMMKLVESLTGSRDVAFSEAIVANFLALSALDSNKKIIGSSGAIPFLVEELKDLDYKCNPRAKQDCLRALYNLSILPSNVPLFLETDLIPFLMKSLGDMDTSERILSTLSNVVSVPEGRKAVSSVPDALPILIDVLNWSDSPGCQEMATYILMVMAHKAYGRDRQAMIEAGIGSALLELTLIGSPLAQKRASRILEFITLDKGKQIPENYSYGTGAAVSAPIFGPSSPLGDVGNSSKDNSEEEANMSEEKKAVKQLVQQSLQTNMRRIVKRANLPHDFVPSEQLKSLTTSATSKSLPL